MLHWDVCTLCLSFWGSTSILFLFTVDSVVHDIFVIPVAYMCQYLYLSAMGTGTDGYGYRSEIFTWGLPICSLVVCRNRAYVLVSRATCTSALRKCSFRELRVTWTRDPPIPITVKSCSTAHHHTTTQETRQQSHHKDRRVTRVGGCAIVPSPSIIGM